MNPKSSMARKIIFKTNYFARPQKLFNEALEEGNYRGARRALDSMPTPLNDLEAVQRIVVISQGYGAILDAIEEEGQLIGLNDLRSTLREYQEISKDPIQLKHEVNEYRELRATPEELAEDLTELDRLKKTLRTL
jgi:hypothetical protein